jgi:hypothetical protein
LTYQNQQLDQLVSERNGYVASGDNQEQIVDVLSRAYTNWQNNKLPLPQIPAIGVQQAVQSILKLVE